MTVKLKYNIEDSPNVFLSLLYGCQHFITSVGSIIAIPLLISEALCLQDTEYGNKQRGNLISTILFTAGIATILQTLFGIRLPILQGGTFTFLSATFALLNTKELSCPVITDGQDFILDDDGLRLFTNDDYIHPNQTINEEVLWKSRMNYLQGSILVAGICEFFFGLFGLVGFLKDVIGPLTVTTFITLVGLSLLETATATAGEYWPISLLVIFLMVIFMQILQNVEIPVIGCTINRNYRRNIKCSKSKLAIFKTMPIILTICLVWFLCYIFTITNVLPENNAARTDLKPTVLELAPWFRFPYPFQWGFSLKFNLAGCIGMTAGAFASMIESIGDYYACAKICQNPAPPKHALNRGIMIEGLGCIFAALMGTGNGTTSYAENIGILEVTKIGSRFVVICAGIVMTLFGIFGKFGALFVTLPSPILGGLLFLMFAIITAVGLSNLQYIDLNSSRNLLILGLSLYVGMGVPKWVANNREQVTTGISSLDQVLQVLLTTNMFLGGTFCMLLDLFLPGSKKERGFEAWEKERRQLSSDWESNRLVYWPIKICQFYSCKILPICPDYAEDQEDSISGHTEVSKSDLSMI